jgi:CitMHS family citrate-Mg2+:H+ or citrate-Ca2+:H+ symporter
MDKRVLACAASLAAGVNFPPWTGPMIRASASLHISVAAIFNPLLPVQVAGLAFVFSAAWWMGRKEARRLGLAHRDERGAVCRHELTKDPLNVSLCNYKPFVINKLQIGLAATRGE